MIFLKIYSNRCHWGYIALSATLNVFVYEIIFYKFLSLYPFHSSSPSLDLFHSLTFLFSLMLMLKVDGWQALCEYWLRKQSLLWVHANLSLILLWPISKNRLKVLKTLNASTTGISLSYLQKVETHLKPLTHFF